MGAQADLHNALRLVGSQSFDDPGVIVMVLVGALIGLFIPMLLSRRHLGSSEWRML